MFVKRLRKMLKNLNEKPKGRHYGCLPIIKSSDCTPLTNYPKRHIMRRDHAMTELLAMLALVNNEDVKKAFKMYSTCLIEQEDGSKSIGISFPEKRWY